MLLSYRISLSCASVINTGLSPNPYRKHLLLPINHTFSGKLLQRIRFWGFAKKINIINLFGCGLSPCEQSQAITLWQHCNFCLKGSYDAISNFAFSLECYKCIDTIPEAAKTEVYTKDILYKGKDSAMLKRLIQTRPYMSTSQCHNALDIWPIRARLASQNDEFCKNRRISERRSIEEQQ